MKTRAVNNEVLYPDESVVHLHADDMQALKAGATRNARQRMRLCAHADEQAPLQEMIVAVTRRAYIRPHKHLTRAESYHVIEGQADLVLFDDAGAITRVIPLGDAASGKAVFCRLSEPLFHALVLRTETLVFHETTTGPFRREESVFAPWAPAENDLAVAEFLRKLADSATSHLESRP